ILVVDATQGVEAQTLSNVYQAIEHNLTIVPVINKIDLASADVAGVLAQLHDGVGLDTSTSVNVSAKTGVGIPELLEAIVHEMPPPQGDLDAAPRALLVDSWFDPYVGVVLLVRVFDGRVKLKDKVLLMATGGVYEVT